MFFDKQKIIDKYGENAKDSGNTKVQIALTSEKIKYLTEHLKEHKKDFASRVGLLKLVGQRKRLLRYLKKENKEAYQSLKEELGIRK